MLSAAIGVEVLLNVKVQGSDVLGAQKAESRVGRGHTTGLG
jgi:hypothetical protein